MCVFLIVLSLKLIFVFCNIFSLSIYAVMHLVQTFCGVFIYEMSSFRDFLGELGLRHNQGDRQRRVSHHFQRGCQATFQALGLLLRPLQLCHRHCGRWGCTCGWVLPHGLLHHPHLDHGQSELAILCHTIFWMIKGWKPPVLMTRTRLWAWEYW